MIATPGLRRAAAGLVLAVLAGPALGQSAPCPALVGSLEALTGVEVTAALAPSGDGWCVLEGAGLRLGEGLGLATGQLRLRGDAAGAVLTRVEVVAKGLRLQSDLGRAPEPVLRETLRLQTADLALTLTADQEGLAVRDGTLTLSGGTKLAFAADIAGAALSREALLAGRVTRVTLDWRNDGRLVRPIMQSWGASLVAGASGAAAVDAARLALQRIAGNLPEALFQDDGRDRLADLLDALPQGRGRLRLELLSAEGLGAARLAIAALSDDPLGPEALARLFSGAGVTVDWQPGFGD